MGSFENLDTEEPLGPRMERHAFDRLIMLSDGVFAIAITLAALEIHPPQHWRGLEELWQALKFSLFAYAVSFMVVAAYWTSQRDLMSRMHKVDNTFTALCLAQLFCVALIPSATRLLYESGASPGAVQAYSATIAACGFLASGMWSYATFKPGLMLKDGMDSGMRWLRLATALLVPVFFTVLIFTGGGNISMMFYVTGVFVLLRRGVMPWLAHRQKTRHAARTAA